MPRRRGFLHAVAQAHREQERAIRARTRAETAIAREADRARKAYERAQAAAEKERAQLYVEARTAEVELQNEQLQDAVTRLQNLLLETLRVDDFIDFEHLKEKLQIPTFQPGELARQEPVPQLADFVPDPPLLRFLPFVRSNYERQVGEGTIRFRSAELEHAEREAERVRKLQEAEQRHAEHVAALKERVANQHQEVDEFRASYEVGEPEAVVAYVAMVLEASSYPSDFPRHSRLAFVPESRQLVVEYQLPALDVIPAVGSFKYVKTKDEITTVARPAAQQKSLYGSVVAQITLRTLHEIFEADRTGQVETIVFNGFVDTIDPSTGNPTRPCLVTIRTSRDQFMGLSLGQVDPVACLKGLNASVSKSPSELVPVRPILDFNMVDQRFIEETDVLSSLDQRPNLMALSPSEFESLITNLFARMGLETRLTRPSRDGGVDCVAYDPRPIFGGKVVIQAKRYADTVGVSAVRDLYGTMINEGASKGILISTSGYGKASFDFADGKPIELLSGSNLLYLLAEHAGIEARIEVPEGWRDPVGVGAAS